MGYNKNPRVKFNCDYCNKESSDRPSHYKRKKRHFCSMKCYAKYREEIMCDYEQPTWKGGITKETQKGRGNKKYKEWQEYVLEKSEGLCYLCGEEAEECHHIKSWADYTRERYFVDNGVALCKSCHYQIHYENPELLK